MKENPYATLHEINSMPPLEQLEKFCETEILYNPPEVGEHIAL